MVEPRTNRRLAAILAADVVGYSRMMANDEAGTLAALKRHRQIVFDPAVAEHNGRIVKLMGDGTLVEFASVVDAVKCALAVQRTMAAEKAAAPKITLRIGVNLGDIVVDGDDIYGDGVNVAARLEPLAEPGGICVASIVNEGIGSRIDVAFRDGGEVQVKNIERPIHIWKWHPDNPDESPTPSVPRQTEPGALPSLAVLPFQNLGGDTEQEYFADGVVEDLITALSRFKSFAVIARNSSFVYKGRSVDVRLVGRELGVRYVLEGSVRRAGNHLRISAQLIDGTTGSHLWAHNFDGTVEDIFDVQDRITESVVAVVEPKIQRAEIDRSRSERPESLAAYDLYLRALAKLYTELAEDNASAVSLLDQAIALAPGYAIAMATATWALAHRQSMGWPPLSANDEQKCLQLARLGLANAREDATVLAHCGMALIVVARDYERGLLILKRAAEANPNNLTVLLVAGIGHLHCGSLDEALTLLHRVLRLSPVDPGAHVCLTGIAHVQMCLGNYPEALGWAERSRALNPDFDPSYWMLIAGNAHLGRMDEAKGWLTKFRALVPGVTISGIRNGQPAKDSSRMVAILDGLRLAGLEEG